MVLIEKRWKLDIGRTLSDRALSEQCMDKSTLLAGLVSHCYGGQWQELLGDLQLSFLLLMLLYSHAALMHWKKLVDLVCRR
jgi:hypothetical protein